MPTLLHKCLTKATAAEGDQMQRGPNWILARRSTLKVFDDHLQCRDWRIDYADIQDAVLFSIRSHFVIPGYVLRVTTPVKTYHFGLNWGRFWQGPLPFVARREKGRLGNSLFSVIVRVTLLACIAYYVWHLLHN
jgi:hypothetical protein